MLEVWFNPERSGRLYLVHNEGALTRGKRYYNTYRTVVNTGFSEQGNNTLFIKKRMVGGGGRNKIYQLRKVYTWTKSMHTGIFTFSVFIGN